MILSKTTNNILNLFILLLFNLFEFNQWINNLSFELSLSLHLSLPEVLALSLNACQVEFRMLFHLSNPNYSHFLQNSHNELNPFYGDLQRRTHATIHQEPDSNRLNLLLLKPMQ